MTKIINMANLLERLKQLRTDYQKSEAKFLLFVIEAEKKYELIWQANGCTNYTQFLTSNHICDIGRFNAFQEGLRRSSAEQALQYGSDWVVQLGKVEQPSKKAIDEFVKKTERFVETNKIAPRLNFIREMKRETFGHKPVTNTNAPVSASVRKAQLSIEEENKQLKAENLKLRERCALLERELERISVKKSQVRKVA